MYYAVNTVYPDIPSMGSTVINPGHIPKSSMDLYYGTLLTITSKSTTFSMDP